MTCLFMSSNPETRMARVVELVKKLQDDVSNCSFLDEDKERTGRLIRFALLCINSEYFSADLRDVTRFELKALNEGRLHSVTRDRLSELLESLFEPAKTD